MGWTLEQLRALVAVADGGTMAAAAAELGYTPGAVSQQMSALAAAAGRPLLSRAGRGVELTDDGLLLVERARDVLAADERARSALAAPRAGSRAVVTLGVFGSAASWAMGPAAAHLREHAPHVDLRAVEVDVERALEALTGAPLDLTLALDHPDSPSPPVAGVVRRVLHTESYAVVAPAGSLTGASGAALVERLRALDWVLPPIDTAFGRAARTACARAGLEPVVRHRVTDTAVSLALAESGAGATLATPLMRALRPTTCDVVELPTPALRHVVALARGAALERGSVRAVSDALAVAFRSGVRSDAGGPATQPARAAARRLSGSASCAGRRTVSDESSHSSSSEPSAKSIKEKRADKESAAARSGTSGTDQVSAATER